MNGSFSNGGDPTRPVAPAFTKMTPQIDLSKPAAGKGGLLSNPRLFAAIGKMPARSTSLPPPAAAPAPAPAPAPSPVAAPMAGRAGAADPAMEAQQRAQIAQMQRDMADWQARIAANPSPQQPVVRRAMMPQEQSVPAMAQPGEAAYQARLAQSQQVPTPAPPAPQRLPTLAEQVRGMPPLAAQAYVERVTAQQAAQARVQADVAARQQPMGIAPRASDMMRYR